MSERVSIVESRKVQKPILFIAPHGFDDEFTDVIAETAANSTNSFGVFNRSWERAEKVDYLKDKANCNNVLHLQEDVVREEFLDPIIRFQNRILNNHEKMYVFILHGMGDENRNYVPDVDVVIGYGAGQPHSHTCKHWMKNLLTHLFGELDLTAYQAKTGSKFSGWSKNNLNQYWRKHEVDTSVHSFQIQIIKSQRRNKAQSQLFGEILATIVDSFAEYNSWWEPIGFKIKEI